MNKGLDRNINQYSLPHQKEKETMNTTLSNIDILMIKSEILLASDGKCAIDTETVYKLFELFKQAQENLKQTN
jgi:hemin uptake protein HemP